MGVMSFLKMIHNGFSHFQIWTWKHLEIFSSWELKQTFLSQSIINSSLHSLLHVWIFITFLFLFLPVCWSNGFRSTLPCFCLCVTQISWPPARVSTNLWKCLLWMASRRELKGHAILSPPTQAPGSLHAGRKKHVVAGNTLWQCLLTYPPSHKGPALPGDHWARMDRQMSGVSQSQRRFIHLFIHFPEFKFRSLAPNVSQLPSA